MRVLVISHMYPSIARETSGIFVHNQVKALGKIGVEQLVISPVYWTPWPAALLSPKWRTISNIPLESRINGIKVFYPRYIDFPRSWLFCSSGNRMHKGIQHLVNQIHRDFSFELIHAHVALPDGYAGALLSEQLEVPLVVTIHGQDLQHTINLRSRCKRAVLFVLKKSDRIIVVSNKLKRLAKKHLNIHDRLYVVPNGVNAAEVVNVPNSNRDQRSKRMVVLSVSNLIRTKGIDFNIIALKKLISHYPELRYEIIGAGPEKMKLEKLAEKLGLQKHVLFLGSQPHHIVMEHIAECTIFSLPSWNEGFGVVYAEAMASGKPVIGCKGEGVEDLIINKKTGLLVKPRDVKDLVKALNFLLSHPDERKKIGQRASKQILKNYTWAKNAEKTIQIYQEALKYHHSSL